MSCRASPSDGVINKEAKLQDKYLLGQELGRGKPGVIVYLCTNRQTNEQFACKCSSKQDQTDEDLSDMRMEPVIMSQLPPHPNIVKLIEAYEDDSNISIVMELCDGGSLVDRIHSRGVYNEREAAEVIHTIVEVVQACHDKGIMHRDLKADNVVFTRQGQLKVIDFGSACFFKPRETFTKVYGTVAYIAPEVLNRKYGPEADIWSVGVILYVILSNSFPFEGRNEQAMMREIMSSYPNLNRDPWPKLSRNVELLLRNGLLVSQARFRCSPREILNHPWMQEALRD